jgi:hypothetical protein
MLHSLSLIRRNKDRLCPLIAGRTSRTCTDLRLKHHWVSESEDKRSVRPACIEYCWQVKLLQCTVVMKYIDEDGQTVAQRVLAEFNRCTDATSWQATAKFES